MNRSTPEELHAAYVAASGIPVSLNRQRRDWLREICAMPGRFTPDDVRAVIAGIQGHLKRGTRGWVQESLLFGNAMKPEIFEERALLCRANAARRQVKKPAQTARTDCLGVTRLDDAPMPEVPPISTVVQQGFKALKEKLRGTTGQL